MPRLGPMQRYCNGYLIGYSHALHGLLQSTLSEQYTAEKALQLSSMSLVAQYCPLSVAQLTTNMLQDCRVEIWLL